MTEADYRQSRACYYACVEQLGEQIGRMLAALEESGKAESTIVVFTTDHGNMVGNHRLWIKGWMPYEETYRVPLIVRWHGHVCAGSKTDRLVQTRDLAHTYVEAASAAPLPFRDVRALQPLFDDPAARSWPDQIMCAYYGGEFLYTQRIGITQRFKYVFNGFDIDEMYDLDRDSEEMHNAVEDADYAKYTDDMRARLYEMMSAVEDPYGMPPEWHQSGNRPDSYGAPRYLPRGRRLNA